MADIDNLKWLEKWYRSQCDGNWEHAHGVKIETIDNPGWSVDIHLQNTHFAVLKHDEINFHLSDSDWIVCRIVDARFHGAGDSMKLEAILSVFRGWVEPTGQET